MKKYLTKSRYKIGRECPTKLYYHNNNDAYSDSSLDDSFMKALARGGFQVGELAKIYNSGGVDIKALDHDQACDLTQTELVKDSCTIYEAAIRTENLFIRVDVLRKSGDSVDLVEVKAKSIDPNEKDPFWTKRELKKGLYKISEKWKPYLYDVAFQTYVVKLANPNLEIKSFLMLANKSSRSSVDGLNQKFVLVESSGRSEAHPVEGTTKESVGDPILVEIDVTEQVEKILNDEVVLGPGEKTFQEEVSFLSKIVSENSPVESELGLKCKYCQFRCEESRPGTKSGFHECWSGVKRKPDEKDGPFVFDVWNFRKASKLIGEKKYLARELTEEDVSPAYKDGEPGFSSSERQWTQVESIKSKSTKPEIMLSELRSEIRTWEYPLHFIDFETSMVALPFNKGRSPYEQMAFQFSHHMVTEDGVVTHAGEYINRERGKFPNFDFLRALKAELSGDNGSIFRYAAHENTVLCQIYDQLMASDEIDKTELCDWIKTITKSRSATKEPWEGDRSMIDLCELVKKFYYHPLTGGSNSIKKVLPAILNDSKLLQAKYSDAIYGSPEVISKNFQNWQWIKMNEDGSVKDPYKLLPSVFEGIDTEKLDLLLGSDELADGGAAMTAYAKMQFSEMSEKETEHITSSLLKYCELDTFAMVLLYEYWADLTGVRAIEEAA
jgi:hypothetical protein